MKKRLNYRTLYSVIEVKTNNKILDKKEIRHICNKFGLTKSAISKALNYNDGYIKYKKYKIYSDND